MEKALDLGSAIFEYNQALTKHKNVSAKHIEAAAIIDAHIALQGLQHGGFSVDYEEANSRIWKFMVIPPLTTEVKSRDLGSCQLHHWCNAV
jgi:hypothetical protein